MSKENATITADELLQLTDEAVARAKARQLQELSEEEMAAIQGGVALTQEIKDRLNGGRLEGYAPAPRLDKFLL